jgi:lysophospholipase L1-like esterase
MANFPVINNGYNDFEEFLNVEGYSYLNTVSSAKNYLWTGAMGLRLANGYTNVGTIDSGLYIKTITIGCSTPISFDMFFGNSTSGLGNNFGFVHVNGITTIPINKFKRIDENGFGFNIVNIPVISPSSTFATVNQSNFIVTKSNHTTVNTNLNTFSIVVTITNYSGSSSSGSLIISDTLPAGCNFISAVGTGFTLSQTGKSYTMTTTDVIANNGTKTYTLTVQTSQPVDFSIQIQGAFISNDFDFSSRPMVWAGTSITAGTGATSYRSNYTYLTKKWLVDNLNIQSRVVNKAISSSQTNVMEDYRIFENWYDFKQEPKFLFIEHGVNDIGQSIPTATSVSNVTNMINYYRKKYPTCYIIILAPFPVASTTTEAGLVIYRAAMQTLVSSYSEQEQVYIKYIAGTGSVWNAATQSGTYTTDGVHVNDAGRLLILNAITNYITTNGLTFP